LANSLASVVKWITMVTIDIGRRHNQWIATGLLACPCHSPCMGHIWRAGSEVSMITPPCVSGVCCGRWNMTSREPNKLRATPRCLGTVPFRQGTTSPTGESMNQSENCVGRTYWIKPGHSFHSHSP